MEPVWRAAAGGCEIGREAGRREHQEHEQAIVWRERLAVWSSEKNKDPAVGSTGPSNRSSTRVSDHADCVVCCLVTPSACGPFCPWTISNSTSSPSCRLL